MCPQHPRQRPDNTTLTHTDTVDLTPPHVPGYSAWTLIGVGGFARVFSATRQDDGQRVAIKVALQVGDERFPREAAALRRLHPPATPCVLAEGVLQTGFPYLVMTLVSGTSLADWLAGQPSMAPPRDQALTLLAKLATVVDEMHARDVLHRDLKPENIIVREDGGITLIDFGLATSITGEDSVTPPNADLTKTGQQLGTSAYMAPEQTLGVGPRNPQSDLYSLGVITFELLCGRLPFIGDQSAIRHGHSWQRPPKLSEIAQLNANIDQVIDRALAKDPAARYANATELVAAATAALAQEAKPSSTPAPSPRKPRQTKQAVVLLNIEPHLPINRVTALVAPAGQVVKPLENGYLVAFAKAGTLADGIACALEVSNHLTNSGHTCVVHVADLRVRAGAHGVVLVGKAVSKPTSWTPQQQDVDTGAAFATAAAAEHIDSSRLLRQTGADSWELDLAGTAVDPRAATQTLAVDRDRAEPHRLCGRDALTGALTSAVATCIRDQQPTLLTIIGDAGMGKTELMRHVVNNELTRWPSAHVLHLSAPRPGPKSTSLLSKVLRLVFRTGDGPIPTPQIRTAAEELLGETLSAQLWPVVAYGLGDLSQAELTSLVPLTGPTAIRQALARAIAQALRSQAANQQPIVLALDDAQWADYTTLDAIELVTMAESHAAICALVAASPQLRTLRSQWGQRAATTETFELEPLDDNSARQLLGQLLAEVDYIPDKVRANVVRQTRGIPGLVVEMANTMIASGVVRQRSGTDSWIVAADTMTQIPVTPMLERLAAHALAGVRSQVLPLAHLCAVIGESIRLEEVDVVLRTADPVLGLGDVDPSMGLNELARSKLLLRVSRGRYRFRRPLLREAIEKQIDPLVRKGLHGAVYAYLQDRAHEPALERLAIHAAGSGERSQAAEFFMSLAQRADARFAYVEAQQHYTSALDHISDDNVALRQAALTGRGKVHHCVGRMTDALTDLETALRLAKSAGDKVSAIDLLLERATILDWSLKFVESTDAAQQAMALAKSIDDPGIAARCRLALGRAQFRQGKLEDAMTALQASADAAERLDDHATRVVALTMYATALVFKGNTDDAEACFADVIALCETTGDRLHLASSYSNRLLLWMVRHEYAKGVQDAHRAIDAAREIGHFQLEHFARHNLAELLGWQGEYHEAIEQAELARAIEARSMATPGHHDALLLARMQAACGEFDRARKNLAWISAHCDASSLPPSEQALVRMVELACDRPSDAEGWQRLLRDSPQHTVAGQHLEILFVCAKTALRDSRGDDAERTISQAIELASDSLSWTQRFQSLRTPDTTNADT